MLEKDELQAFAESGMALEDLPGMERQWETALNVGYLLAFDKALFLLLAV